MPSGCLPALPRVGAACATLKVAEHARARRTHTHATHDAPSRNKNWLDLAGDVETPRYLPDHENKQMRERRYLMVPLSQQTMALPPCPVPSRTVWLMHLSHIKVGSSGASKLGSNGLNKKCRLLAGLQTNGHEAASVALQKLRRTDTSTLGHDVRVVPVTLGDQNLTEEEVVKRGVFKTAFPHPIQVTSSVKQGRRHQDLIIVDADARGVTVKPRISDVKGFDGVHQAVQARLIRNPTQSGPGPEAAGRAPAAASAEAAPPVGQAAASTRGAPASPRDSTHDPTTGRPVGAEAAAVEAAATGSAAASGGVEVGQALAGAWQVPVDEASAAASASPVKEEEAQPPPLPPPPLPPPPPPTAAAAAAASTRGIEFPPGLGPLPVVWENSQENNYVDVDPGEYNASTEVDPLPQAAVASLRVATAADVVQGLDADAKEESAEDTREDGENRKRRETEPQDSEPEAAPAEPAAAVASTRGPPRRDTMKSRIVVDRCPGSETFFLVLAPSAMVGEINKVLAARDRAMRDEARELWHGTSRTPPSRFDTYDQSEQDDIIIEELLARNRAVRVKAVSDGKTYLVFDAALQKRSRYEYYQEWASTPVGTSYLHQRGPRGRLVPMRRESESVRFAIPKLAKGALRTHCDHIFGGQTWFNVLTQFGGCPSEFVDAWNTVINDRREVPFRI